MLWMITDFSKTLDAETALKCIKNSLSNGVGKVTIRNKGHFSKKIVLEMKNHLDRLFPGKEIFMHDPENSDFNSLKYFHFPSKRIEDAIKLKIESPNIKVAVSTHSTDEYKYAFANGINYVFLSPVFKPLSKPGDIRETVVPVKMKNLYLLGGIDRMKALLLIERGFTNLAGISLFYGERSENDIKELSTLITEKEYGYADSD